MQCHTYVIFTRNVLRRNNVTHSTVKLDLNFLSTGSQIQSTNSNYSTTKSGTRRGTHRPEIYMVRLHLKSKSTNTKLALMPWWYAVRMQWLCLYGKVLATIVGTIIDLLDTTVVAVVARNLYNTNTICRATGWSGHLFSFTLLCLYTVYVIMAQDICRITWNLL